MPADWIDDASLIRLRDDTLGRDLRWPGVIAGKGGKEEKALSWLTETFLRPIGCTFSTTGAGTITVKSLLDAGGTLLLPITVTELLPGRQAGPDLDVALDLVAAGGAAQ